MKLTPKYKQVLAEIRESGEQVVIEDNWLVYLAKSHRCAFGVTRNGMDVQVVRSTMQKLNADAVAQYRQQRNASAREYGQKAIAAIQEGRYDAAQSYLKLADNDSLSDSVVIELYRQEVAQ